ncbi:MAG TPA: FkbM family methyltransferase [Candidatus Woesebacteria bacterium]|nr:FkbM family methyltransferase [Candidatus Woesebacteria bacterium]
MPTSKLPPYTIEYSNSEEYHYLKREIWSGHCYYTELEVEDRAPVIVDAGAHIGISTLYFAKHFPTAQIIAIEPNPITRELLENNIWNNRLEDRVSVLPVALSNQTGSAPLFHLPTKQWQLNANLTPQAWNGDKLAESLEVETITLSSLISQPTDIVKLDIEGAELLVLKESRDVLHFIQHLWVEFHPSGKNSLPELTQLLIKQGFKITIWQKEKIVSLENVRGLCLIHATKNQLPPGE